MTFRIVSLFLLFSTLIGCGSFSQLNPVNPPSVKASGILPNCDGNGACVVNTTHSWGYCQMSTYQTAKTFSVTLEAGITANPTPTDMMICTIPFATGGNITSIDGNTNYTPWTANLSSMFINVRSCTTLGCDYPGSQEHLISHKYTVKGNPQSVSVSKHFAVPITSAGIIFVFNDDLANAKPTTLSVAFSGTFQ